MGPIKDRVMRNNEDIAKLLQTNERHTDKIRLLEIIYKNHNKAEDGDRPKTIFDTINNKIADNAVTCRKNEQTLQGQINLIKAVQEDVGQNVEVQRKITDTISKSMDICTTSMSKL